MSATPDLDQGLAPGKASGNYADTSADTSAGIHTDTLPGIADCHFHVIAPLGEHAMAPDRSYTPAPAPLVAWRETLSPLGVTHGVVVQPSFYGMDNSVLLQALAQGDGRLVGIAAVEPGITDRALDALVRAGVHGVRMAHVEAGDTRAPTGFVPFEAFDALESRLHDRGMHLQLLTDSRWLPGIAARLARARVPVVIDHMGRMPAAWGNDHPGFRALCRLLADGHVWVKLSGVANMSSAAPDHDDVRGLHEALLAANPEQLVWGSDWPHTRPSGATPRTAHLLRLLLAWTPSPADRERILQRNPQALYQWDPAPGAGTQS
jgi:predicted TIM-barrel fold metal-dependent hydrolase